MKNFIPKVSIGLLVYNEEDFIRETIKNILQQSYQDFELIIGDNNSSDGTTNIIKEFSDNDKRIYHIIRDRNIGALKNWNDVVSRARGKYFILAGGHDLWSSNYLEMLVQALDKNIDCCLAFAPTKWIDSHGNVLNKNSSFIDTNSMSRLGRFTCMLFSNQHYLYGLIRIDCLLKTRLQLEIVGSGEILLQELGQLGYFKAVNDVYWYRRINRAKESTILRFHRYKKILFSSRFYKCRFKYFPLTQLFLVYLCLPIHFKETPFHQRLQFYSVLPIIILKHCRFIIIDLLWFLESLKSSK